MAWYEIKFFIKQTQYIKNIILRGEVGDVEIKFWHGTRAYTAQCNPLGRHPFYPLLRDCCLPWYTWVLSPFYPLILECCLEFYLLWFKLENKRLDFCSLLHTIADVRCFSFKYNTYAQCFAISQQFCTILSKFSTRWCCWSHLSGRQADI